MNDNAISQAEADNESDKEARRRIREDLRSNFLVEAAAGTGKTSCIIERMVNLVATDECSIEKLVAVTFTRTAAAELRERFHAALRSRVAELQTATDSEAKRVYIRLQSACDYVGNAFVGTIHGFCSALLRERPIEFAVDPGFRELEEEQDTELREQAWQENINHLFATNDPIIQQIDELGLERRDLKLCFDRFIEYRDVSNWPSPSPPELDLATLKRELETYLDDMRSLTPTFPTERGNDKLMARYEEIVRASESPWEAERDLFDLLEKFDTSPGEVQSRWLDKKVAKAERDRFKDFRVQVAGPALQWWRRKRYRFVVRFVRRAVGVYQKLKDASSSLDYNDLLLKTSQGLKSSPELRRYFQNRYTHILVDEFQDTDPVQAELLLFLTAEDHAQQDGFQCRPKPGSLFLVGDPKQSIYRFRRGDIVTYSRVKKVFRGAGGQVLPLVKNFRCRDELRTWNNRGFRKKFGDAETAYSVAAEDMLQGRVDQAAGDLFGVRKLSVPWQSNLTETTKSEAERIASFIRGAIDSGLTTPRTAREIAEGKTPKVQPQDFLIVPRGKKRIHLFKEALERRGVPCQALGGNAFLEIKELSVLVECLRTLDDPHHPVHYLAVLRDRLFAFNDAELFAFQQAGGKFSLLVDPPEGLDDELRRRFQDVNIALRQFRHWLRVLPFAAAVSRIAAELGLLASAAARQNGNVVLGGFFKSLELLRQNSADFDSAADLIGYFEQLQQLDESQSCTALAPESNVVRIMNLHKVKGLEAPIVFLTDTAKGFASDPICHIDRSGAQPTGYMGIMAPKSKWSQKEVATPQGWVKHQKEEQAFLDAEAHRLLYVATTRAACMLVVSVGSQHSAWAELHEDLAEAPELTVELPPPAQAIERQEIDQREIDQRETERQEIERQEDEQQRDSPPADSAAEWNTAAWSLAMRPSYAFASAKELALKGAARPHWGASGAYGPRWGSALHGLLEIAEKTPSADLRASAQMLAKQFEIDSARVGELTEVAVAVTRSQIWRRSQASSQRFSELPLETVQAGPQGAPQITRAVIDLLFEEPAGWVIVDYKSDEFDESNLENAIDYYRPQLQLYARSWREATGLEVAELGLYFTRLDSYQKLPQ